MGTSEVKTNEWLLEGITLYKNHFGFLVFASFTALFISGLSLGILAGPMLAGLVYVILELYDGDLPAPGIGDLFKGFRYFLPSLLFMLPWGLLIGGVAFLLSKNPIMGQAITLILYLGISAFLMFGLFLIVDDDSSVLSAIKGSTRMVLTNPMSFLGFGAFVSVIGSIGGLLCIAGLTLTLPMQFCILAVSYRELFGGVVTEREALVTDEKPPVEAFYRSDTREQPSKVWELSEQELEQLKKEDPQGDE